MESGEVVDDLIVFEPIDSHTNTESHELSSERQILVHDELLDLIEVEPSDEPSSPEPVKPKTNQVTQRRVSFADDVVLEQNEPPKRPAPRFTKQLPPPGHLLQMVPNEESLLPEKEEEEEPENLITFPATVEKDDDLLDFSNIPAQPIESEQVQPQWVLAALDYIRNLLNLQPSISIHRSKLFALFDVFRELLKNFHPDLSLPQTVLKQACALLIETINKTRQVVYSCSAAHWSQSAVTWPSAAVRDAVKRIREDINECLVSFGCQGAPDFSITEEQLEAQNKVDDLQLKGSLLDYLNRLNEQPMTQQLQQLCEMITQRLSSIGPVDGIDEGPAKVGIAPFLPAKLNLVLEHSEFTLGDMIGSGTFGCVYVGTMVATGKKVAVKVLNAKMLGGRQLETFKREVWTMATLNHPSILRLLGVTLTAPFCIITELLQCSLYDKLRYLTPTKRSIIAFRVSQAMEQLHAARIIHRDLKSGNILLDENDLPRVCDFGLVGFKTRGTRTGYVGTAQWMAPEILRSSPFYDEKVDVYSFAVLLWEMLTLSEPYKGMTQDQMVMAIIEKGARPAIPPHFGPPKLVELIKRCWSEKPSDRPSFQQITAALFSSEVHFTGTDEQEFAAMSPHQLLSTNIVHAFDCCNWSRLDDLLLQINPEQCESDPELLNVLISLFPGLDSERQRHIVERLPNMVDLQTFLCMRGYSFIVSLFTMTSIVVEAAVETLRKLPLSSKGFRQVKLISTLARTRNEAALAFCADLCEFEDIAEQIVEHDIPFSVESMDLSLLRIYRNILRHEKLRSKVSNCFQPLHLAKSVMKGNEKETCEVLRNYPLVMAHADVIIDLDLITAVAEARFVVLDDALKILSSIFVICTASQLEKYGPLIDTLIDDYREVFEEANILLKLVTMRTMPA